MITQFQVNMFRSAARYMRPTALITTVISTAASIRLGYVVAANGRGPDETAVAMGITTFLLLFPAMIMRADQLSFELAKREQDLDRLRIEVLKPSMPVYPDLSGGGWQSDMPDYISVNETDGSVSLYQTTTRISLKQLDFLYRLVQHSEKTGEPVVMKHITLTGPPDHAFKQGEDDAFLKGLAIEHLTYKRGKSDCLTPRGTHIIRKTWGLAYPGGKATPIALLPH